MRISLACVVLAVTGCAAHVSSTVQVNGDRFAARTCRSGQAYGFSGVELEDDRGQRLRLAHNLDGTFQAVYFPPGNAVGENMGACGTMTVQQGTGVINGVRNVEGGVTLTCRTQTRQVMGSATFENCH